MSGSNVTAVSVPATVHMVATASKRTGDRSYLALLLALSALVMGPSRFCTTTTSSWQATNPTT
jgi:hypothetical protein